MPKRSERDEHWDVFDGNPFEDMPVEEMYADLQWGNDPNAVWDFDAPEPMAAIGQLAGIEVEDAIELHDDDGKSPFVAVGQDSNNVYIIPKADSGGPVNVPTFNPRSSSWRNLGEVTQTDYYSDKGGELGYYYHNHEGPYPTLWEHARSGCRVLVPARHRGKRSYAVGKAGIVG